MLNIVDTARSPNTWRRKCACGNSSNIQQGCYLLYFTVGHLNVYMLDSSVNNGVLHNTGEILTFFANAVCVQEKTLSQHSYCWHLEQCCCITSIAWTSSSSAQLHWLLVRRGRRTTAAKAFLALVGHGDRYLAQKLSEVENSQQCSESSFPYVYDDPDNLTDLKSLITNHSMGKSGPRCEERQSRKLDACAP